MANVAANAFGAFHLIVGKERMKRLTCFFIGVLFSLPPFGLMAQAPKSPPPPTVQEPELKFPLLLKKAERDAGNPLATYAAMLELDSEYRRSKIFAGIYPEVRANMEEFLGFPRAGIEAMSLPIFRRGQPSVETAIPTGYRAENALDVIEREARKTRLVIFGEEHHLPQTRSLHEAILRRLWKQGYRYLAAEAFDDSVMEPGFKYPTGQSGFYTHDPVYASAVRVAVDLGYKLVAYDTSERGPDGDNSFRDRTQAENIKSRIFDRDPQAKVFVIAGRGHASEVTAPDGWTPMASVLKRLTGIDPFTLYAPSMSERLTPEEEEPYYRYATSRGLVNRPSIFVDAAKRQFLGSGSCDAYVFWPRMNLVQGRPDWMAREMGRKPRNIPAELMAGTGLRLVQVFREGEPAAAIPIDQVVIGGADNPKVMMLPTGRFWLRVVDRESKVLATGKELVR